MKQKKIKSRIKKKDSLQQAAVTLSDKTFLSGVNRLVEPVCDAEGLELVHTEYQMEPGGKVLRLYIDKPDGISIDDCAAISRQVSDLLDIYIESDHRYRLEVSSPGSNRPLTKQGDFNRFKGQLVRIHSSRSIDGQKKFKGTLTDIKDGIVTLAVVEKSVAIPFEDITKARLINYSGEN
ncbi:ribosome maturation factor RimP [Thermodesulfobacteriota bacterium]